MQNKFHHSAWILWGLAAELYVVTSKASEVSGSEVSSGGSTHCNCRDREGTVSIGASKGKVKVALFKAQNQNQQKCIFHCMGHRGFLMDEYSAW